MTSLHFRMGARASILSQTQANSIAQALTQIAYKAAIDLTITPHFITASADQQIDRSLAELGGKGLFSRELDEAQLNGQIDFAVHSLKDLETNLPEGIELIAVPAREDPADGLISPWAGGIEGIPLGASLGTASQRRQAMVSQLRPDIKISLLRGNVQTRLKKVAAGEPQCTFLALAGLRRLGLDEAAIQSKFGPAKLYLHRLAPDAWLPAAAQGALAITVANHAASELKHWLQKLDDRPSRLAVTAERAMLARLDGTCRTPIAAHAWLENQTMTLSGYYCDDDDYSRHRCDQLSAPLSGNFAEDMNIAQELGDALGQKLKSALPPP